MDGSQIPVLVDGVPAGNTNNNVNIPAYDSGRYYNLSDFPAAGGLANQLPTANGKGISGTVIPRSTIGGIPKGFDALKPMQVNIVDVDRPGESFSVNTANMNSEMMATLTDNGRLITKSSTSEEARDAAVEILRKVAASSPSMPVRTPVSAQSIRATQGRFQSLNQSEQMQMAPAIQTPEEKVTFEIDGFGAVESYYHTARRHDVILVLSLDNRYRGASRYFPQPPPDRCLLVDVHSLPEVFQVSSQVLQFPFENHELLVLFIERSAPKMENH